MMNAAHQRQAHYIRLQGSSASSGFVMNALQTISMVANALVSIVAIAVLIAALPAIWSLRKTFLNIQESVDKLQTDIRPLLQHATTIAENVSEASTTIKSDVQDVSVTVREANQRVRQALTITERRLSDFNAFLRLVQEEGESLFFSAASAVRGVRTGATAFQRARKRRGMDLASDESDEADEIEQYVREEDEDNGGNEHEHDAAPAPRIRPRQSPRRSAGRDPSA